MRRKAGYTRPGANFQGTPRGVLGVRAAIAA
jgi:hypothetical protein